MAKLTITEDRLQKLINESIAEAIEDEGIGDWLGSKLGNAYQWARNQARDFRGAFDAGRKHQRYVHKDADPYSRYQDGDKFRNLDGQKYADYRYDQAVERNQKADQYADSKYKGNKQDTATNEPEMNPSLSQPGTAAGAKTAQPAQNNGQQAQFGQNQNTRGNVVNKSQQMLGKYSNFLKQKGFALQNGQWIYTKDGSNSPALQSQYPDIVQAAKGYNMALRAAKGLYEQRISEIVSEVIKEKINEVGDTKKGQYMLGRLSGKRENQANDAYRKTIETSDQSEKDKLMKQGHDYLKRASDAKTKSRNERSAAYNGSVASDIRMHNAFNDGLHDEQWKSEKKDALEAGDSKASLFNRELNHKINNVKRDAGVRKIDREEKRNAKKK